MNNNQNNDQNDLRPFLLMSELEHGEPISQREIAGRAGLALGLVNAYLKTLVQKGYVTVKAYPRNRYAYLLTPKGFAEKSRLAFKHLSNFNKIYRVTRQETLTLFKHLHAQGVDSVSFCGCDDLTEIIYLSLQEAGLKLLAVMDTEVTEERFFDLTVVRLEDGLRKAGGGPVILTALQRAGELKKQLLGLGVLENLIYGPTLSFEEILRTE